MINKFSLRAAKINTSFTILPNISINLHTRNVLFIFERFNACLVIAYRTELSAEHNKCEYGKKNSFK